MTDTELLEQLRELEGKLRGVEVQAFFLAQDEPVRRRFASLRNELSHQAARLSNAELRQAADKLDELSPGLEAGIRNLKRKIDRLESAVAILNSVGTVLGLAARVIAFLP